MYTGSRLQLLSSVSRGAAAVMLFSVCWLATSSSHNGLPSFNATIMPRDSRANDIVSSTPGRRRNRHSISSIVRTVA